MKKLFLILLLLGLVGVPREGESFVIEEEDLVTKSAMYSAFSYQQAYGFNSPVLRHSFDVNINLILLNFGYNYNNKFKSNMYIGIGYTSLLQMQYGYALENDTHLLRVRSDYPIGIKCFDDKSVLNGLIIGGFFEYAFDDNRRGSAVGMTFGYTFWSMNDKMATIGKIMERNDGEGL